MAQIFGARYIKLKCLNYFDAGGEGGLTKNGCWRVKYEYDKISTQSQLYPVIILNSTETSPKRCIFTGVSGIKQEKLLKSLKKNGFKY